VWILDRFGRRKLLIGGGCGAACAMFYIAAYVAIAKPTGEATPNAGGYVAIVMIYVFVVFYCASWNGIVWIYCSEIFPLRIRTLWYFLSCLTLADPKAVRSLLERNGCFNSSLPELHPI